MDIKHFAIQQWVKKDLIDFQRIPTIDNSADAMTKATPRTLFYRHMNHILGRIIPSYVNELQHERRQQLTNIIPMIKTFCVPNRFPLQKVHFGTGGDVIMPCRVGSREYSISDT